MSILLSAFPVLSVVQQYNLADIPSSLSDLGNLTTTYQLGIQFANPSGDVFAQRNVENPANEQIQDTFAVDPDNTWVRMTQISGDLFNSGLSAGVWYQCNTTRLFSRSYTTSGGNDIVSGTIRFDLSSDVSGTPIEATSVDITWQVGETF